MQNKTAILEKTESNILKQNIFALSVLQFATYILPLLTVPYLVRILGVDYFGLLAIASTVNAYFILLTDYGFNRSATRQISIHRHDHQKIIEIFTSVFVIKFVFLIISLVFLVFLVNLYAPYKAEEKLFFYTFGLVIGQTMFPIWLFQGLEKMRLVTYISLLSKLIFTISIFVFVDTKDDYLLVPLFTALGSILSSLLALFIAVNSLKMRFCWPKYEVLGTQLLDGWHIFSSSVAISVYTLSSTLILGAFSNTTAVGYFAAADKIIQAVKGLYKPISQAVFPLLGKKLNDNKQLGLIIVKKIALLSGAAMLLVSILLYVNSKFLIDLIYGEKFNDAVILLQIMAFIPLMVALSNILGVQTMVNLGYQRDFSMILFSAAILGIVLNFILIPRYDEIGSAITLILVETVVTAMMFIYLYSRERNV